MASRRGFDEPSWLLDVAVAREPVVDGLDRIGVDVDGPSLSWRRREASPNVGDESEEAHSCGGAIAVALTENSRR